MKKNRIVITIFLLLLIACRGEINTPIPPVTEKPEIEEPEEEGLSYNGIKTPDLWPPQRNIATELENGMNVPYLQRKPSVINISIGRQLFVDDFLIESSTLQRKLYYPEYYSGNPILAPTKRWETVGNSGDSFAAPFSDGVWYDELDHKYKMWYEAGGGAYSINSAGVTCYAESDDGFKWVKPTTLEIVSGTNIVDYHSIRDASAIWVDKQETNPKLRYKMFLVARNPSNDWEYNYKSSENGINWKEESHSLKIEDRSTVYKNPFRNVWSFSMRHNRRINPTKLVRCRLYTENESPAVGTSKAATDITHFWFGPWAGELRHPLFPMIEPAIYNHDAIAYESIMLAYFSVWQGPENDVCGEQGILKRNQIMIGYSRDGYHWSRDDLNPFLPVQEVDGSWNYANIQSVVGTPLIVEDKLYFYLSGRKLKNKNQTTSTGVATLRRDGFASMKTDASGTLIVQQVRFNGVYFFINANVNGSLKVELLNTDNSVISGFAKDDCIVFKGDNVKKLIQWKNRPSLAELKDKKIKIKFYVEEGEIFSFWISPWESGESNGYTGGGGPGLHPSGIDKKE